jgi:FkbM family methyltransferase
MIMPIVQEGLTPREQKIYDLLQDDLSKELFLRINEFVSLWVGYDASKPSVDLPAELFFKQDIFDFIEQIPDVPLTHINAIVDLVRNNRCIQYGYFQNGRRMLKVLKQFGVLENVVAVYDKDPKKTGERAEHLSVQSLPKTRDALPEFDYVIVAVINNKFLHEVFAYFSGLQVDRSKLLVLAYENEQVQYFDKDIIIPRLSESEVFIDAGCLDFSSSSRLLELAPGVKKIYAFEPDEANFERVKSAIALSGFANAEVGKYAWWSSETVLHWVSSGGTSAIDESGTVTVETRTIDGVVPDDELVTYIKMDIEGAELEALKGGAKTIARCRPKMAISLYHKPYDYLDLIEYALSLIPDYKVYVRQYYPYNTTGSVAYFV